MILYGTCAPDDRTKYIEITEASIIDHAAVDGDVMWVKSGSNGICAAYNEIIGHARREPDCDALVLLHDDTSVGPLTRAAIYAAIDEPGVGVIGACGARSIPGLNWWDGRCHGRVNTGASAPSLLDFGSSHGDVDAVDGLCMVLTPLAFNTFRFDETRFPRFHGYDIDFCFQARNAGLRVLARPLDVWHHNDGGYGNKDDWDAADKAIREKWPSLLRVVV